MEQPRKETILNLGLFRVVMHVETNPTLVWAWRYRNHYKRYVKRHIPHLAYTCDWCGSPIKTGHVTDHSGRFWVAGCVPRKGLYAGGSLGAQLVLRGRSYPSVSSHQGKPKKLRGQGGNGTAVTTSSNSAASGDCLCHRKDGSKPWECTH